MPGEIQERRDENNTENYQNLNLKYPNLYKNQDSYRQQTAEKGGHVYAVVDSPTVEPPSQYDKLQ